MIRILHSVSNMDRAGIETMLMNYYRYMDKSKVQFDFLCNKKKPGAYDDEIKSMGGRIYHTPGLNPAKYPEYLKFMRKLFHEHAAGKQDKTAQLKEMLALVDDAERVLTDKNADLDDFGRMLDHTWRLKRQTGSAVSTNSIDDLYAKGVAAGALGGKLLGAGGGGFLVFYVQPERQDAVRWAMRDLMHIPFAFEDGGTRVIHYTPETYIPKE